MKGLHKMKTDISLDEFLEKIKQLADQESINIRAAL